LNTLHQQFQPQAAEVLRGTDQKISALLTPEQQARYEKIKETGRPTLRRLRSAAPYRRASLPNATRIWSGVLGV